MSPFRARPSSVRVALVRFSAGAVAVLLVVVLAAVLVANRIATREALEHAELDARTLAAEYVLPLGADVLDPGSARASLDEVFEPRIARDSLRRIKIWEDAGGGLGRIIYSDDRTRQRALMPLGPVYELFASGAAHAEIVSADDQGVDAFPAGTYEVYVGFRDGAGTPFIFEAYLPTPDMAISRNELLREWLPLLIGSLVLLALASLPLAVQLARRAGAAEAERGRIARRALRDVLGERRRLAQRLHDGPVQGLSGVGLVLDSVDRSGLDPASVAALDRVAGVLRDEVGELRAVGDDLFPDAVSAHSLEAAVDELSRALGAEWLGVRVRVDSDLHIDEDETFLVYRIVREGLRNVVRHASATSVDVMVQRTGDEIVVEVRDDGVGPGRGTRPGLGLRLLTHEVREHGGVLELRSGSPGTALHTRFIHA